MKKTISPLQVWLTVLSVSAFLISNIITSKQMVLPFNITMTCAVIVFPITYILSDVFSEVYGYKWSRITCYMSFLMNLLMVIVFEIAIKTNAPEYWINQSAFEIVLGNTPRILCSSLIAFIIGDFVNDRVFKKMKEKHGSKHFGIRAILSSVAGELSDSIIFIPCAFYGTMPISTMITMLFSQVILKVMYELVILPITSITVNRIKKYEHIV